MKICVVGASGKLGRYMVKHALDRGYEVVGVCREQSVSKLDAFRDLISIVSGPTDDRDVIKRAVIGSEGVLVVLAPWGMNHYASGTAAAPHRHPAHEHLRVLGTWVTTPVAQRRVLALRADFQRSPRTG